MLRVISILWLLWCGVAWANVPRGCPAPLNYTTRMDQSGYALGGHIHDPLWLRTNITRYLGLAE